MNDQIEPSKNQTCLSGFIWTPSLCNSGSDCFNHQGGPHADAGDWISDYQLHKHLYLIQEVSNSSQFSEQHPAFLDGLFLEYVFLPLQVTHG